MHWRGPRQQESSVAAHKVMDRSFRPSIYSVMIIFREMAKAVSKSEIQRRVAHPSRRRRAAASSLS